MSRTRCDRIKDLKNELDSVKEQMKVSTDRADEIKSHLALLYKTKVPIKAKKGKSIAECDCTCDKDSCEYVCITHMDDGHGHDSDCDAYIPSKYSPCRFK